MTCSALALHRGFEIFTAMDMKHQKDLIGKGTLTIQKLIAIWMWETNFTVLRHLFKKLNVCKSVKRDSGINFEASFVAVYSNYILLFCMKSEND